MFSSWTAFNNDSSSLLSWFNIKPFVSFGSLTLCNKDLKLGRLWSDVVTDFNPSSAIGTPSKNDSSPSIGGSVSQRGRTNPSLLCLLILNCAAQSFQTVPFDCISIRLLEQRHCSRNRRWNTQSYSPVDIGIKPKMYRICGSLPL